MTRSCLATSASRACALVTSSEMGVAFWMPAESALADSKVLQAVERQCVLQVSLAAHKHTDSHGDA